MSPIDTYLKKLDELYGELKRDYERGDPSLETIARVQVDTMMIIGRLVLELRQLALSPFGRF